MAAMSDIRAGLAANLRTVPTECTVSEYRLDNPVPPTLHIIGFDIIEPIAFGGGSFTMPLLVQGLAGNVVDRAAQEFVDDWLFGAASVWAAIESDRTLAGACDNLAVLSCDGSQIFTLPNQLEALGSTWHIQVEVST